jgi:hypothetical protein
LLRPSRLGWLALGLLFLVPACGAPGDSPQTPLAVQTSLPTRVAQPEVTGGASIVESVENTQAEDTPFETPAATAAVSPVEAETAPSVTPTNSAAVVAPVEIEPDPMRMPAVKVDVNPDETGPDEADARRGPSEGQLRLLASLESRGAAPELHNEVWLNSEPLKLADLRGKVVIVEFWTFG